jgi:thymidylate synthase
VNIWNEWADENGEIGPLYGKQLRNWECYKPGDIIGGGFGEGAPNGFKYHQVDQIKNIIDTIKTNPDSRRLCMTTWNPVDLPEMKLAPCHGCFIQLNCQDGFLDLTMYQRSCDVFLGVPFNISSYALLLHMIAQVCDMTPRRFNHVLGDVHIYNNHEEQVREQLSREPYSLPILRMNPLVRNINDFKYEDITLFDYKYQASIKADVAV